MTDQNTATVQPEDYSTWLGCRVQPSPHYPDRVFLAGTATGLIAIEACYDGWYWMAKVRITNEFEGLAMARSRAEARATAQSKLLEALSKDPKGLLWIRALNLFVVMNPNLITGEPTCPSLN